jgi:hypothetical protein
MNLSTKKFVGEFSFYANKDGGTPVSYIFAKDINKDGVDEVFFAGFETQPNTPENYTNTTIHIFGWIDDQLQEITSQLLPDRINEVEGVGDVSFGDFNGDGLTDVFLSGYTDMEHPVNAYVLMNQGTTFKKISLGHETWMHAVSVGDINFDGYDDVIVAGYSDFHQYLGSPNGLVKYQGMVGSSGVALGDFLGNGTLTAIFSDAGQGLNDTFLFGLDIDEQSKRISFNLISRLPGPRLEELNSPEDYLSHGGYSLISSHDIRLRTVDFNNDGLDDVVLFSYRYNAPINDNEHRSEIQFLANLGYGQFEDVTEEYRINYDVTGYVGYFPQISDFNLDGRKDIFVSQPDYFNTHNSSTLLLQNMMGKFVDTQRELFQDSIEVGGQAIIASGPNNQKFLISQGAWNWNATLGKIYIQELLFPERELAEHLVGSILSEKIWGLGGDDNIYGDRGDDMLDGGQGLDTAEYIGNSSQYSITVGPTSSLVVDNIIDRDGKDELINIERLQFADINLALDINGTAGQAYRIYEAVLGRAPDLEGLGYWINDMDNGVSLTTIAQGFIASPEFQDKYGVNPSYDTYVNLLYQNILDRAPDEVGLNYWLTNMRNGVDSPAAVLASFSEGYENTANVAPDIANGIYYDPWLT